MTTRDSMISGYLKGLSHYLGSNWNQFWFAPSDMLNLCVLRIAVGAVALVWQWTFAYDLVAWLGPSGLLSDDLTRGVLLDQTGYTVAYLRMAADATSLWILHIIGTLVLLAWTLGIGSRLTGIGSLVVVLTYLHRTPLLIGPGEPVLAMMIAYLCIAPMGSHLSIDARLRRSKHAPVPETSWSTLASRLIQVHLCLIYLYMGLAMLNHETWWQGVAIWWISAQPDSRIVDLTFLRDYPQLLNLWSHLVVFGLLGYSVLVWNRWLRPLMLVMSTLIWVSLGLATANLGLGLILIVANLAFVPSEFWRATNSASLPSSTMAGQEAN